MSYKWRRIRVPLTPIYVVLWKGGGASGCMFFSKRRPADRYASKERKFYGKNSVRKSICPVPSELTDGFIDSDKGGESSAMIYEYLQENYARYIGED